MRIFKHDAVPNAFHRPAPRADGGGSPTEGWSWDPTEPGSLKKRSPSDRVRPVGEQKMEEQMSRIEALLTKKRSKTAAE